MSDLQKAYDNLAISLEEAGIKKSNMFGMSVLKLGRRPIGGLDSDGVMFKLPADSPEMKLALGLEGSHLFQPSMKNKKGPVMKQWVIVPIEHSDKYFDFALKSINFVEKGSI